MAKPEVGVYTGAGVALTTFLIALAGCTPKSDAHLPIERRVANAYGTQWEGGGATGYLCLAKTEFDTSHNEFSDFDPATLTVDAENERFTVTSALGAVLNMRYTVTIDPNGKTKVTTFPADEGARTYMLAQGCELSE